eukprot:7497352-Alexandrium_andersonii.AAC.1
MSASLVGSEMCIRDRKRAVLMLLGGPGPARLCSPRVKRLGTPVWIRLKSCLLYTSDAADDM